MPGTTPAWVLDEDEALELLAYLVTAARTQVDEAAEYGPLRLLTAAVRLPGRLPPRSSDATAAFGAGSLEPLPVLAVPRSEREEYVARLDELCRALAAHLTARWAPDRVRPTGPATAGKPPTAGSGGRTGSRRSGPAGWCGP